MAESLLKMEEIIQERIVEEVILENEIEKEIFKNVTEFKIEKNPPVTKPTKELTQEEIDEFLKPRK